MAKSTQAELDYQKEYYKKNKAKIYARQKAYREEQKKKEDEGKPVPKWLSKARKKELSDKYREQKQKEDAKKIAQRQYKSDWLRKKKQEDAKIILAKYNKDCGYE